METKTMLDATKYWRFPAAGPGRQALAAESPLEALREGRGPIACRHWSDGTRIAAYATEGTLRAFARRCALDVVGMWPADPVVLRYLTVGDPGIQWDAHQTSSQAVVDATDIREETAAWAAVWATSGEEAWDVARRASVAAVWAEVWDAVAVAQRDGAETAAWTPAGPRREAVRRATQNIQEARDDAWETARRHQDRRLAAMLLAAPLLHPRA